MSTRILPQLSRAFEAVRDRIVQRWTEARDTMPVEIVLFGFALTVGLYFTFVRSGFQEGWTAFYMLGFTPRMYGLILLLKCMVRAVSIYNGDERLRQGVAWFGFVLDGSVVYMIWRSNSISPLIPYASGLPILNLYVLGRRAKVASSGPS